VGDGPVKAGSVGAGLAAGDDAYGSVAHESFHARQYPVDREIRTDLDNFFCELKNNEASGLHPGPLHALEVVLARTGLKCCTAAAGAHRDLFNS